MTPPSNKVRATSDCQEPTHPSTRKEFSRNGANGLINFMMLFVILAGGAGLWLGLSLTKDKPSKISPGMIQPNPAASATDLEVPDVVYEDELAVRENTK